MIRMDLPPFESCYFPFCLSISFSNHLLTQGFSAVAREVGIVLVVLGGMHFINMFNFAKIRSKSKKRNSTLSMRR